jgi:glycosyltransferase involved in cell wall biosynthesis
VNICFTSHRYAPLIGGYDNQIKQLAEQISKHHNVKVITYNLTTSPKEETINQVEVTRVNPQLVFFRVPLSLSYLKKIGSIDYDLLHAHGFVPVVSDLSIAYAKSKSKKTVYTHHFDGNVQDAKAWNNLADIYNKTIARQSLHYADAIVATTKSYAETSPVLKSCLNRVQTIPCFVDCEQFKPAPKQKVEELRHQLNLGDRKTVLFVGRIVPYKGVEYLIKAVELAKAMHDQELNLLLLGGGEGKSITNQSQYYQYIQELARKSPVSRNIHFVGRIESNQLASYYSLVDAVALPSVMRGEAFGAVLLESLACGTPVVASNIPGVRDVLKKNNRVGRYFNARDTSALADSLLQIANQKTSVSEECRQFAQQNYSLDHIIQEYLKLYSMLD